MGDRAERRARRKSMHDQLVKCMYELVKEDCFNDLDSRINQVLSKIDWFHLTNQGHLSMAKVALHEAMLKLGGVN